MRSRLLALCLVSNVLCGLFSISSSFQYLCWFVPSSQVQMDGELVVWNRSQTLLFRVEQTRLFWANQTRLFWMDQTRLSVMGQHWLSIMTTFQALVGPSSSVLASILFLPLDSWWWVKEPEVSKNITSFLQLLSDSQCPSTVKRKTWRKRRTATWAKRRTTKDLCQMPSSW